MSDFTEQTAENMRVDPARAKQLISNLEHVRKQIDHVRSGRNVRLIAVSKLKPATDILALHGDSSSSSSDASTTPRPRQVHFGENYAQELTTKAGLLPRSIKWHMIGGLQTNKCKPLAEQVPNLWCVSSVDSAKKADALEKGRAALLERQKNDGQEQKADEKTQHDDDEEEGDDTRLRVLVQINTSGEESKAGVTPGADAVALVRHIDAACPHLRVAGFMTIGAIARSRALAPGEENADFTALRAARDHVAREVGVEDAEARWELSMGMSADFEAAIRQGSDEVRVGTGIFGERPAKQDAKVL